MRRTGSIAAVTLCIVCVSAANTTRADTLTVTSIDDNTLYETANGEVSGGASTTFFVGRVGVNGEGKLRRGVIKFDLSALPTHAVVESVSLKLHCSAAGLSTPFTISLKRMLKSWGEGVSFAFGGGGASSTPGDATWLHRFYPNTLWSSPGGDFSPTVSASTNVGSSGFYTWATTPTAVADVQGWVNVPVSNFGWMVQGNEITLQSAKRFDSHESALSTRPQLTVVYTVGLLGDLNGDDKVNAADLSILLGAWGQTGPANIDNLGVVDAGDLAYLLSKWTG